MKNNNIITSWDEIAPNEETEIKMFNNIQKKLQSQKKSPVFRAKKIIAATSAMILIIGLINIQTVIAFFSGLFFVPGVGITDDVNIIYYGIEEPLEIDTEYGIMKIEYISKVTQGNKTDLNIYMVTTDSFPVSWLDPLIISAYSNGKMIFEDEVLDRTISHDAKAFFFTYKNFPDINTFDLNLYGSSAEVSLKEITDTVAFSKANNGVTLAVQKVNGSENMYFTGIYGESINPDNYRFSGAMSRFSGAAAYDTNGDMFELLDQGAERFFSNGFSVGFHKTANEIKGFKCDMLELYYSKELELNIFTQGPIDSPAYHPFDIFELPVPKDGETIEADIVIPVGQYSYKITSVSREGDRLYIEDNSSLKLRHDESSYVSWEPTLGTPEYEQAVENQEYSIGWVTFISGDLTEDMKWYGGDDRYERINGGIIKSFDKNAETIKLALAEIQINQYGDFNIEFE